MIQMCFVLHVKYPFFCLILMKLEFSRRFFERYSDTKCHEIRPVGAELFRAERWTDGHDVANSRFLQFCERVKKTALILRIADLHYPVHKSLVMVPVLSQTIPAHIITRHPFKVCLYHPHIYVFVSLGTLHKVLVQNLCGCGSAC
jgi:hypothetical protein